MNIKKLIAENIDSSLDVDLEKLIIESISADKGDYCLPCFALAKNMHMAPMLIANEIATKIKPNKLIDHVEVVAGYVNFFLNKTEIAREVLNEFNGEASFNLSTGNGKTVCIDFGSPNLAKYLHIGHLKTLVIGESLCRLFEQFGYRVFRLDFAGDYGTPFGKMIGGMQKWGSIEDVEARGNDALQEYYVKFNQMEAEDASYTQLARDIFKKIEEKDSEIYPIYQKIVSISLKDCEKMFDILGVKFDDNRGEFYYNQFVPQVVEKLRENNLLVESQGAQIVDLSAYDMAPSVIIKNDGTSLYASRDLSAVMGRYDDYKFDKMIYVTDIAQNLHFKQWFKIVELLKLPYADRLEHVAYGRFSLPDGKISSRRGKQAVLVDLMEYAHNKAEEIIKDRTFTLENPADVANKVTSGVLNYSVLKVERNKDCVFDMEKAFSFEGETAPYMQYTYTRLLSILRKHNTETNECDFTCFNTDAFELVKMINNFIPTLSIALEKRDTSIVARQVMEMCKTFNHFYTTTKVLDGVDTTTNAKIKLVESLKACLNVGFKIICIDTLKEM